MRCLVVCRHANQVARECHLVREKRITRQSIGRYIGERKKWLARARTNSPTSQWATKTKERHLFFLPVYSTQAPLQAYHDTFKPLKFNVINQNTKFIPKPDIWTIKIGVKSVISFCFTAADFRVFRFRSSLSKFGTWRTVSSSRPICADTDSHAAKTSRTWAWSSWQRMWSRYLTSFAREKLRSLSDIRWVAL